MAATVVRSHYLNGGSICAMLQCPCGVERGVNCRQTPDIASAAVCSDRHTDADGNLRNRIKKKLSSGFSPLQQQQQQQQGVVQLARSTGTRSQDGGCRMTRAEVNRSICSRASSVSHAAGHSSGLQGEQAAAWGVPGVKQRSYVVGQTGTTGRAAPLQIKWTLQNSYASRTCPSCRSRKSKWRREQDHSFSEGDVNMSSSKANATSAFEWTAAHSAEDCSRSSEIYEGDGDKEFDKVSTLSRGISVKRCEETYDTVLASEMGKSKFVETIGMKLVAGVMSSVVWMSCQPAMAKTASNGGADVIVASLTESFNSFLFNVGSDANDAVQSQLASLSPLSIAVIFGAGLVTSFSPCTLSVLPLTIGYIGGYDSENVSRSSLVINSLAFTAGLSTTLTLLGVVASLAGKAYGQIGDGLPIAVSLVALYMGLNLLEVAPLRLPTLLGGLDVREVAGGLPQSMQAYLAGLTFALAASPCSTPVLATLLAFASGQQDPGAGAALLLAYTTGYSTPLLVAASLTGAMKRILMIRKYSVWINPISGAFLVGGGVYSLLTRVFPSTMLM